jgi:hypothetical protein
MDTTPTYSTGEPILAGDVVLFGVEEGVVELVIAKGSPAEGYIQEGVMLLGPTFGRMHVKFGDEDLILVGRTKV